MIKSIIIEDEPIAVKIIKGFIDAIDGIELVGSFSSAEDGMDWLSSNQADVIFQDINLPGLTGLDFVKSLSDPPKIIFTTANPEFAVDGFEINAVDYLVKPIAFERFNKAIEKLKAVLQKNSNDSSKISFKANGRIYLLDPALIHYFESSGDYIKVFSEEHNLVINQTMKELNKTLNSDFIRIHKSFIVNQNKINYYEGNQVCIGDKKLPIGATFRQPFLEAIRKTETSGT